MYQLDEKDAAILDVLKQNSSLSIQKIAKRTGIPVATVHNRIKKLKIEDIIQAYTIRINQAKLGKKLVAHILIKAMPQVDATTLLRMIARHDFVEAGSALAGEYDVLLKVRVADVEELEKSVLRQIRSYKEVYQTQTLIAFENIVKY